MAASDGTADTAGTAGTAGTSASDSGAPSRKYPIWQGPLALVVGLGLLVGALLLARAELRYGSEGIATSATIIRLWVEEGEDSEGDSTYSYRVGYELTDPATSRTFTGSAEVGQFRYLGLRVGDAIEVSYLASDPGENRLGTPEPQLILPMAIGIFGGLALVTAPLLVASSIRARRAQRIAAAPVSSAADDARRVDVFTRSPIRAADGPLALLFGVALLTLAAVGVTMAGNMPTMLFLTLGGSLLGIYGLTKAVTAFRRGLGLRLVEVGPDGLWLLGMGRVAWAELDEVRIEEPRASRSSDEDAEEAPSPGLTSRRLGVVPRDPASLARRPDRLEGSLGKPFFGFLNMLRPNLRFATESDQAPYGIAAGELEQSFDALVASIGRFATVGARTVQPLGETMEEGTSSPNPLLDSERPLTESELLAVDARLGRPGVGSRFVDGD